MNTLLFPIKQTALLLMILGGIGLHAQELLDKYLYEAGSNNPGLKSKFNEYQAALEQVPQVGALPDPLVTFGYFIQPVETRVGPQRARISASQMFPWFGKLGAKKDVATAQAKAKYESFEQAKSQLFFDVKSAYFNLYFTNKAIVLTSANINILNTFRKLALIKVETGQASSIDVLRVEMEIADLENQLSLLNDSFDAMKTGFNNILNIESQRIVDLPDTLNTADLELSKGAILDSIKNGNHQILQTNYLEAMYKKQQIVAKKMGMPDFMLGFDYIFIGKSSNPMAAGSESGKDAFAFPIIGISIPIHRHKYSAMVKEAALKKQSTIESRNDKINSLETIYARADKDYKDAGRRIILNLNQMNKATSALNILRTNYETSGTDFVEILRMERQFLKYQLELEKARADKGAAIASIQYLMGK